MVMKTRTITKTLMRAIREEREKERVKNNKHNVFGYLQMRAIVTVGKGVDPTDGPIDEVAVKLRLVKVLFKMRTDEAVKTCDIE